MRTRILTLMAVLALGAVICLPGVVWANNVIIVDEYGHGFLNGTPLAFSVVYDPGPGDHTAKLTYTLPFTGVQGDVMMYESPSTAPGMLEDVIRFNGALQPNTLVFYSYFDPTEPPEPGCLADVPLTSNWNTYTNWVFYFNNETEPFIYTPTVGQPGYDPDYLPTYHIYSDAQVPIPGALVLLGVGLVRLVGYGRRKKALA